MKSPKINLKRYKPNLFKNNSSAGTSIKHSKHEVALEISNVGLWDWDIISNKVFYSKESKAIIGYKENELNNSSEVWDDKVHEDDRETYFSDFNLHLNGELDLYEHEYRIKCKDGNYKWILDKGKVVERDSENKPTRVIGTHIDITSLKKQQSQLNNNLQLITSQNERLHNFTHIVSHNLKTHIGNFKNILEFYDEANNDKDKKDLVDHLKTISNSLTTTIVDLDDIIRIKSKANINQLNERVDLHECIDKIIESLKLESSARSVSIFNALRKDENLITNRAYLDSVFYNIISNGIKYSDSNKSSQIIIQSIHTKENIKILISDNGIGMDMDKHKDQLFDMYKTFHGTEREDSRGIGLYITKIQIEALQGEIEVESTLDEGTAFSLTFKKRKAL